MQPQVKVTNISHSNGSGFGLWIGQRFIKPGEFAIMPVDDLPGNYHSLVHVLDFEFMQTTVQAPDPNTQLVQQLIEMQKSLLDQVGQMREKLDQQAPPQAPQIHYVSTSPGLEQPLPSTGVGAPHFIPAIGEVQADIQITSTSSKAVDGKALRDKLRKAKK